MKYFSDELLAAANRGDLTSADSVALYAGYMRLLETNDRVQDEKRRVAKWGAATRNYGIMTAEVFGVSLRSGMEMSLPIGDI